MATVWNRFGRKSSRHREGGHRPSQGGAGNARRLVSAGLPGKLLMLTATFVLVAEIFIFLPSVASYRVSWLSERLTAAQLAALASEAFPGGEVPSALRADLLRTAQVKAIASRSDGERRLVLPVEPGIQIQAHYDLRSVPQSYLDGLYIKIGQIKDAIALLFSSGERMIRVVGRQNDNPADLIEIVIPEAPLRQAMIQYGLNILGLSVVISALTAALVYFSLSRLLVQPAWRALTNNMLRFSADPEGQSRILTPSGRLDEIGVAERELSQMQKELSGLLAQKNRLAQLGLAVSKINHDLRNLLANAQLISDRLVDIQIQRFSASCQSSLPRSTAPSASAIPLFSSAAWRKPRPRTICFCCSR